MRTYPVIDLFAGPGGLGEGFSSQTLGRARFRVALSIENDNSAHRSLTLRALFRRLEDRALYYNYVRSHGDARVRAWDNIERRHSRELKAATKEAWRATLGQIDQDTVGARIKEALGQADQWVLIGGPPCQAYSLVGRARMRGTREDFDRDERHLLYQEYLRIVAAHAPPVFVMENVKGLLSSQHAGGLIFERIVRDLTAPRMAIGPRRDPGLRYRLVGLGQGEHGSTYTVRSEDLGIPQARHRVILLGIRDDIATDPLPRLATGDPTSLSDVISDMPRIRSGLSQEGDTHAAWATAVAEGVEAIRLGETQSATDRRLLSRAEAASAEAWTIETRGAAFTPYSSVPERHADWYLDSQLGGLIGHFSRRHMRTDLWRYLFAASHAAIAGRSPTLDDFPRKLLPSHRNASLTSPIFADRFRVQLPGRPASTVTSHIAKDGNYFIHYDAAQCRSLSIREAARVQTFPDNYAFEGGATQQYHQIGNAVPPLLARAVARAVAQILG